MTRLRIASGDTCQPVRPTPDTAFPLLLRAFAIASFAASLAACGGLFDNGVATTPDAADASAVSAASAAAPAVTEATENAAPSQASIPTVTRVGNNGNASGGSNPSAVSTTSAGAGGSGSTTVSRVGGSPGAPQPSVTPAATPTVAAGAPVETIIADMKLFHDGPAAVLEALPGWGSGAGWPEATPRPAGYQYAIPWTHVVADTSHPNGNGYPWRVPGPYTGNQAPNTRVQQRDVQMWWLLSDGRWVLGSHSNAMEPVMYPIGWLEGTESYGTDVWRNEAGNGGGVSMRSIGRERYARHLWHTWAAPHVVPDNAVGSVVVFFARKILDNPNGPDDRSQARLMAGGAGDWYRDAATLTSPKVQGYNVLYMGYSRLKYVTNDWQLFGWTSIGEAQLRSNPPPIIGLR